MLFFAAVMIMFIALTLMLMAPEPVDREALRMAHANADAAARARREWEERTAQTRARRATAADRPTKKRGRPRKQIISEQASPELAGPVVEPLTMEPDEFAAYVRAWAEKKAPRLRDMRIQASAPSPLGGYTIFGSCSVAIDPESFRPDARFVLAHYDMRYYVRNPQLLPRDTGIDLFGPDGLHYTVNMGDVYDAAAVI